MTSHGELADRTDQYTGLNRNTDREIARARDMADLCIRQHHGLDRDAARAELHEALWMLGIHTQPEPPTYQPRSWTGHLLAPRDGAA